MLRITLAATLLALAPAARADVGTHLHPHGTETAVGLLAATAFVALAVLLLRRR